MTALRARPHARTHTHAHTHLDGSRFLSIEIFINMRRSDETARRAAATFHSAAGLFLLLGLYEPGTHLQEKPVEVVRESHSKLIQPFCSLLLSLCLRQVLESCLAV